MENKSLFISPTTIPEELNGPLPRKACLSSNGLTRCIYAWGLLTLGIAGVLWFCLNVVRQNNDQAELSNDGKEVVGEITKYWSPGRSSNLWIRYSFSVDGALFGGEAMIPENLLNSPRVSFNEHSPVSVLYLPTNPKVNYPIGWDHSYSSNLMALIPLFGFAIVGIALLSPFPRYRQLIKDGVPTVGIISKVVRGKGRTGGSMYYEFCLDDGRIMSGNSPSDEVYEVGESICILYLPQNPNRNQMYSQGYYRVTRGCPSHS